MNNKPSEASSNFGARITSAIHKLLAEKRISVLMDVELTGVNGDTTMESIYFKKAEDRSVEKLYSKEGVMEYFIHPDVVIVENGVGAPKLDLNGLIENGESGSLDCIKVDSKGLPYSNMRFSLLPNDHASPINAVGSATQYPSFFHKLRVRTDDVKYNMESAFHAAMWMLDK